jgi:hypothetical protein
MIREFYTAILQSLDYTVKDCLVYMNSQSVPVKLNKKPLRLFTGETEMFYKDNKLVYTPFDLKENRLRGWNISNRFLIETLQVLVNVHITEFMLLIVKFIKEAKADNELDMLIDFQELVSEIGKVSKLKSIVNDETPKVIHSVGKYVTYTPKHNYKKEKENYLSALIRNEFTEKVTAKSKSNEAIFEVLYNFVIDRYFPDVFLSNEKTYSEFSTWYKYLKSAYKLFNDVNKISKEVFDIDKELMSYNEKVFEYEEKFDKLFDEVYKLPFITETEVIQKATVEDIKKSKVYNRPTEFEFDEKKEKVNVVSTPETPPQPQPQSHTEVKPAPQPVVEPTNTNSDEIEVIDDISKLKGKIKSNTVRQSPVTHSQHYPSQPTPTSTTPVTPITPTQTHVTQPIPINTNIPTQPQISPLPQQVQTTSIGIYHTQGQPQGHQVTNIFNIEY